MNIVTLTAKGNVLVRPDTTWERDNEDFYVPEFVSSLLYSPILFARISKPGRSIGGKFASRYYDAIGYGMLLYPADLLNRDEQGWACASCLDHTSFLPYPLYSPVTFGQDGNSFVLRRDGKTLYTCKSLYKSEVEAAISKVSGICYLRTGDMVAIELAPPAELCDRTDHKTCISGEYCGNAVMEFNIIY